MPPPRGFWAWYERYYWLNVTVATGLFVFQALHLFWLGFHVIALRLTGESLFPVSPVWQLLLVAVDYTEVPALIGTSLIYLHELRRGFRVRHVLFLLLLNSQWLHLFWITDEFVVHQF